MKVQGKTSTGFEFTINTEMMDNMELLDMIAEADGNPLMLPKLVKTVLGDDQRKALYDHLRTEDGRVPIMAVSKAIVEIFNSSGKQGKN